MEQQDVQAPHDPMLHDPMLYACGAMPPGAKVAALDGWRSDLRRAVLSRVVPRLSDAGREVHGSTPGGAAEPEAEVSRFCDLALTAGVPGLLARAESLRAAGMPVEVLMERVMAPAARRLGDLWLADRLSFLDVTAGLGRLQGLLRALDLDPGVPARNRRILLTPAPGEQHVFGLSVVMAFFRRAGWDVSFEPRIVFDDLLALVRAEPFPVVGLSVAGDRFLPALPGQVEALRRASLDPDVVVLAGGPAFQTDPGLRDRLGVDAVAEDAAEAVRVAEALSAHAAAGRARS